MPINRSGHLRYNGYARERRQLTWREGLSAKQLQIRTLVSRAKLSNTRPLVKCRLGIGPISFRHNSCSGCSLPESQLDGPWNDCCSGLEQVARRTPVPLRPLRIGTRGSPMALRQTALVADRLTAAHPNLAAIGAIEIVTIRTTGDRVAGPTARRDRRQRPVRQGNRRGAARSAHRFGSALAERSGDVAPRRACGRLRTAARRPSRCAIVGAADQFGFPVDRCAGRHRFVATPSSVVAPPPGPRGRANSRECEHADAKA